MGVPQKGCILDPHISHLCDEIHVLPQPLYVFSTTGGTFLFIPVFLFLFSSPLFILSLPILASSVLSLKGVVFSSFSFSF